MDKIVWIELHRQDQGWTVGAYHRNDERLIVLRDTYEVDGTEVDGATIRQGLTVLYPSAYISPAREVVP